MNVILIASLYSDSLLKGEFQYFYIFLQFFRKRPRWQPQHGCSGCDVILRDDYNCQRYVQAFGFDAGWLLRLLFIT